MREVKVGLAGIGKRTLSYCLKVGNGAAVSLDGSGAGGRGGSCLLVDGDVGLLGEPRVGVNIGAYLVAGAVDNPIVVIGAAGVTPPVVLGINYVGAGIIDTVLEAGIGHDVVIVDGGVSTAGSV